MSPLDILDAIDGIVDDTHPEGHGCPLCVALTELRAALAAPSTPEPEYDADGDPIRPDPHSNDWYDGYAAGQRDAAPSTPEPSGAGCDRHRKGDVCACRIHRSPFDCEAPSTPEPSGLVAALTDYMYSPHKDADLRDGHTDGFCRRCADQYAAGNRALLAAPSTPEPKGLRAALYECFDDERFMTAHLNARSLADAVMADPGVRAALAAPSTPEYDADGEPIRPDPHSNDWYDGYAAGQREAAASTPKPRNPTGRTDLCPDCGHHLHRPNPGKCQWYDCPCEAAPSTEPAPKVMGDPERPWRDKRFAAPSTPDPSGLRAKVEALPRWSLQRGYVSVASVLALLDVESQR